MEEVYEYLQRRRILAKRTLEPGPALFLDRDGVLIEDRHHICNPEEVRICKGAKSLIQTASSAGWPVVVITNQSGISRNLFNWEDYEAVTNRMLGLLGEDCAISAIYANGHGPEACPGSWRKPNPGMLEAAAQDLNIDIKMSIVVGDRLTDLMAGARAGALRVCHLKTGHGKDESGSVQRWKSEQGTNGDGINELEVCMLDDLGGVEAAFRRWART